MMLVCLGLGALSVQGLIGPMNGELAATLPAHMKTFGLSLYVFFQDLLQPCYVAIMGVGLQVIALCSMSLAIAAQLLWCKILQNSCHSQSCLYCLGFLKQPVSCRGVHENHRAAAVGNHAKLKAKSETVLSSFAAARTFLTSGLALNLCLAAILFVAASFNIRRDIR